MLNAQVVPFLEVTSAEELKSLLSDIMNETGEVHKSVIAQEIEKLQQKLTETIQKIDSVQKEVEGS